MRLFSRYKSLFLFLAILVVLLTSPLIDGEVSRLPNILLGIFWAASIGIGGYAVSRSFQWMLVYAVMIGMVFLSVALEFFIGKHAGIQTLQNFGVICIQICAFYVVLKYSLSSNEEDATDRTLCGICGYFLLGLIWSRFFILFQIFDPGAFSQTGLKEGDLIYFSLVNLTTLGYGDITPINSFVRIVATLESAFGTLYLAVMVATLVSELRSENSARR
ncbi:potassium channel family protein [Puniceicoccaceae bacterium K14]|nr:potassium channel family protein [Puniceicoccaceae bacterium K14]